MKHASSSMLSYLVFACSVGLVVFIARYNEDVPDTADVRQPTELRLPQHPPVGLSSPVKKESHGSRVDVQSPEKASETLTNQELTAAQVREGYRFDAVRSFTNGSEEYRWYWTRANRAVIVQQDKDASGSSGGPEWFADSLVLTTHDGHTEQVLLSALKEYGVSEVHELGSETSWRVTFQPSDAAGYLRQMEKIKESPKIASVGRNLVMRHGRLSNDPLLPTLYSVGDPDTSALVLGQGRRYSAVPKNSVEFGLKAAQAWESKRDCSAIRVAVIDSGIDAEHPDLAANVNRSLSRNFVPDRELRRNCSTGNVPSGASNIPPPTEIRDASGHGTHVAGTIGAVGNNGIGVAGVCWKAEIVALRVFGNCEGGTDLAYILAAMNYAASINAKVVNMSLGGRADQAELATTSPTYQAISRIADAGGLVVVAAGNDNADIVQTLYSPASLSHPSKITIASHNALGNKSPFSNFNSSAVHLSSPGERIMSTWPTYLEPPLPAPDSVDGVESLTAKFRAAMSAVPNSGYAMIDGTSMASPNAAGVAALVWSLAPTRTAAEIRDILFASADRVAGLQNRVIEGRRINLERAVAALGGLSVKVNNAPAQSKAYEASAGVGAPLLVSLEGVPDGTLNTAKLMLGTTEVGTCTSGDGTCVGEIPSTFQPPADGTALPLTVSTSGAASAIPVAAVRVLNLSATNGLFQAGQAKAFCRVLADNKTLAVFPTANKTICTNVCRKLLAGANRDQGRCDFADQITSIQTEACNVGAGQ